MLYKRSSFIKWLSEVKDCDVTPLKYAQGVKIMNGSASVRLWTDSKDRIDYEEIYTVIQKLWIDGLPGDSDLEKPD